MGIDLFKTLDFRFPGSRVVFGVNSASNLSKFLKDYSASEILFVTDKGIVKAGILNKITEPFESTWRYSVFDEIEENPSVECVEKCAKTISERNSGLLIAVGGGSSIDTAKMAGVLSTNSGSVKDYIGLDKFQKLPLPLVAVPTTAGTGSEVSPFAIITDTQRNVKSMVASHLLVPKMAVLDPSLLASLPRRIAVNTSMDAFAHNVEYYLSKSAMPLSEAVNLQAIRMIADNVRVFVCDPSNLEAAGNMLLASMMGEISFTLLTRLTIAHPMANPPSIYLKIAHGMSVAILLPRVVRFNLISCPEKLVNIARLMGEAVDGLNLYEAANKCVLAIESLSSDLGIPRGFKELGMTEDHVEIFTRDIMGGPLAAGRPNANPRRVNAEDIAELYRLSM